MSHQPNRFHFPRFAVSDSPKAAAYLGDTEEVVLATYAYFLPHDDDRAREIMNAFSEVSGEVSCAADVQQGSGESQFGLFRALLC